MRPLVHQRPRSFRIEAMKAFQNSVFFISRAAAVLAALIIVYMVCHILLEIFVRSVYSTSTFALDELIGYTYTFPREDKRSFLRDCREFSTMLNSCGRINKSGVGISICMGDRNKMLREGEKILGEYRSLIRDYMKAIGNERWRTNTSQDYIMVNAEGLVTETMTGTISSLIAGSPKNVGKIVILRTDGSEGTVKFSSRKSNSCKLNVNLSQLMKNGAEKFDGMGGGHDAAAGAKITKDKLDEFLDYLEENVTKVQS